LGVAWLGFDETHWFAWRTSETAFQQYCKPQATVAASVAAMTIV
jgi:hypothetical protein